MFQLLFPEPTPVVAKLTRETRFLPDTTCKLLNESCLRKEQREEVVGQKERKEKRVEKFMVVGECRPTVLAQTVFQVVAPIAARYAASADSIPGNKGALPESHKRVDVGSLFPDAVVVCGTHKSQVSSFICAPLTSSMRSTPAASEPAVKSSPSLSSCI